MLPCALLDANPTYAKVRHADGRGNRASTSDLAPFPNVSCSHALDTSVNTSVKTSYDKDCEELIPAATSSFPVPGSSEDTSGDKLSITKEAQNVELRRIKRQRRPPERWGYH